MTLATALLGFAVVAAALTVTPGLDTALVLRSALAGSRRDAAATAAGIIGGLLVWGVATAAGISALLATSRTAYDLLRIAGAAYLVWSGSRLLWRAARTRSLPTGAEPAPGGPWRAARQGLLTNLLNPKVGAFYVALIPQFVPAGAEPWLVGLLLAAVHALLSAAWFTLLVLLAGALAPRLQRGSTMRVLDGVTGAVLVGFGLRLAGAAR